MGLVLVVEEVGESRRMERVILCKYGCKLAPIIKIQCFIMGHIVNSSELIPTAESWEIILHGSHIAHQMSRGTDCLVLDIFLFLDIMFV